MTDTQNVKLQEAFIKSQSLTGCQWLNQWVYNGPDRNVRIILGRPSGAWARTCPRVELTWAVTSESPWFKITKRLYPHGSSDNNFDDVVLDADREDIEGLCLAAYLWHLTNTDHDGNFKDVADD